MKYTGFIAEIDEYPFSRPLKQYYLSETSVSSYRELVIAYLKSGVLCVPFMGIAEDEDETRMGAISVLTDGEWFWPAYFTNYLEKYSGLRIDPEFEDHVLKNQGKKLVLSEQKITELEKQFLSHAKFK
ncbi:MAG: hypothetical protein JNK27_14745 [Chitinophagaceae bacterium]|nr:hypothetical protein [Chitinophagaceae bacterium]